MHVLRTTYGVQTRSFDELEAGAETVRAEMQHLLRGAGGVSSTAGLRFEARGFVSPMENRHEVLADPILADGRATLTAAGPSHEAADGVHYSGGAPSRGCAIEEAFRARCALLLVSGDLHVEERGWLAALDRLALGAELPGDEVLLSHLDSRF